ncbi:MAG: hypothetical protein EPO12_05735 [Aquabacterium sp.]|jgi:preprotein translocase subunit SecA|nr:MAG: hypothetical protein EPO12_05735 [Aquabacterium sp.]
MPEAAAVSSGQWPPADAVLAARVFAERADHDETGLDRWVAGWLLSRKRSMRRRQRERLAFVSAVEQFAAQQGLQELDDTRLRAATRAAARRAFLSKGFDDGAQALALIREAARRTLGLFAHPPQLLAAWKLLCGHMVELDTGEGKTLTAGLAACMGALAGVPTHVVTVNDYLAQRDAQKCMPLFAAFGLRVGVVHSGVAQALRAAEYQQDLTYCTNKDLVFDYLRDRVNAHGVHSQAQLAVRRLHGEGRSTEALRLRGLHFAIVDEADSILIDEARTPLILSTARDGGSDDAIWRLVLQVAAGLEEERHFELAGPQRIPELTLEGRKRLDELAERHEQRGQRAGGSELVTEDGAEQAAEHAALAEFWRIEWVREHYVLSALRALHVLVRDQHYVVHEGKIVIVDEFTGRLLPDRSWEQGLHQLVEVKEGCATTGQNRTLARLTYQIFFSRYLRLSGMSGTLGEVARETAAVYRVPTLRVEPNKPSRRILHPALLLKDTATKEQAIVEDVKRSLARGQAVLVGTRSVWSSESVSKALTAAGVAHRVLNALQNADEAELVAQAGQPGAVTVATNMAGRGTDIPLAPAVAQCGGLHVILTEWHESARIDRQLIGRGARQGDPGSGRAIVALDDDVIERHGESYARWAAMRWACTETSQPPQWAITALKRAVQFKAESGNAAMRRATLRSDKHMRQQLAFSGSPE